MPCDPTTAEPHAPQGTLFRFGLRSMLLSMGGLCILFAGMSAVGGMLSLALLLVAVVVAAHVLSTFVGTQLRDGSTATTQWEFENGFRAREPFLAVDSPRPGGAAVDHDRARQLQAHGPVVRRLAWLVAAGTFAGAAGFAAIMRELLWPQIGVAAIVAGAVAAGILGGWLVFLGFSFYVITRRAWREAVDGAVRRPAGPPPTASANTAPDRM